MRYEVPNALRGWGWNVRTIWDVYGAQADTLDDDVWLQDCATNQWVALTRDYLRKHRRIIAEAGTRVFRVGRAAGNPDLQIAWIYNNRFRIEQQGRKPGPYIRVVREKQVEPFWVP